jgi:hypothetical protein
MPLFHLNVYLNVSFQEFPGFSAEQNAQLNHTSEMIFSVSWCRELLAAGNGKDSKVRIYDSWSQAQHTAGSQKHRGSPQMKEISSETAKRL